MSRVNVRDSIDSQAEQWAAIRWAGASKQALGSKRGQAALLELEAALLALPQKRLIYGHLFTNGEVCALGALALHQGVQILQFPAVLDDPDYDEAEPDSVDWAKAHLDLTYTLAWEVMYANDDLAPNSPEERYAYMLRWVRSKLVKP